MYLAQLFSLKMLFSQKLKGHLTISRKLLIADFSSKGSIQMKKVLLSKATQISSLTAPCHSLMHARKANTQEKYR